MAAMPHHFHNVTDEDDDDFDWDEAVRATDVACQSANCSTKSDAPQSIGTFDFDNKRSNILIQSTLDHFLGCKISGQDPENRNYIDEDAAGTWIYPVNVPPRDYQISITRNALFTNTLVVLPTGLGKTLIAAVVMYNYFRWFPEGKIVFAAPSRPLVMQQIEACHNIAGIPQEWVIEMTGHMPPAKRACLWKTKRVFFLTPQVLEKDIQSGTCLMNQIVCLVIDEAHRAVGNYSYCVVVRELMAISVDLRILALTATPGSSKHNIQQIIDSLQISILEYRSESDPDVSPYMHDKTIELIQVPVGDDVDRVSNILLDVIRPFATRLSKNGLLPKVDLQALNMCDLLDSRDRFRQTPPQEFPSPIEVDIEAHFAILITLCYIRKLLSGHGIRPAYEMLNEKSKRSSILKLVGKSEAFWNAKSVMQKSIDESVPNPKISKLIEVLSDHFARNSPQSSRVIIFSNYRGSVRDIMNALALMGETVKAAEFVGQNSGAGKRVKGLTQKVQQAVLDKFRAGAYNVIVATSIGEEGLDIIEVGLVICFDANISSLRMIQRMGRTGRNSNGRVVVLACEGTEMKGYNRKQSHRRYLEIQMRNGGINSFNFHTSPRMIPHMFKPEVKFVTASISQFVRQGKKMKSVDLTEKTKDSDSELLVRLSRGDGGEGWKPSLIAFPNFQVLPSYVINVLHSVRTQMFVDAMKLLHGEPDSCSSDSEVEESKQRCSESEIFDNDDDDDVLSSGDALPQSERMKLLEDVQTAPAVHPPFISTEGMEMVFSEKGTAAFIRGHSAADYEDNAAVCTPIRRIIPDGHIRKVVNSCSEEVEIPVPIEEENEKPFDDRVLTIGVDPICRISESHCMSNDAEFSPRLTNLIESGVVPESPLNEPYMERMDRSPFFDIVVPSTPPDNHEDIEMGNSYQGSSAPIQEREAHPPSGNAAECSCSMDWKMSSGEKSQSVDIVGKFKRLRKYGVNCKKDLSEVPEDLLDIKQNLAKSFSRCFRSPKRDKKGNTNIKKVRAFVEEEAEVSSNTQASCDEGCSGDASSYDGSFIDDAVHSTLSDSQVGVNSIDMMAIYRRSLLSQSPIPNGPREKSTRVEGTKMDHIFTNSGPRFSADLEPCTVTPSVDNEGIDDDYDVFYEGIDLDAVEAQATIALKSRTESPNFDLGF